MTFAAYLKTFKSTWGALTALAVAVAALLKLTPLVPPWPDQAGFSASALAVLCCMIGVTIGYFLPVVRPALRIATGMVLVLLSLVLVLYYLYLLSLHVVSVNQNDGGVMKQFRVVVGTELVDAQDAKETAQALVEREGMNANAWTLKSVTGARIHLIGAYMTFYLLFTMGMGTLQGMKRPKS